MGQKFGFYHRRINPAATDRKSAKADYGEANGVLGLAKSGWLEVEDQGKTDFGLIGGLYQLEASGTG